MKTIAYKGRKYLVASPRLCGGSLRLTCEAWTTRAIQDIWGKTRIYPNNQVKGVLVLNDLARLFLEGNGEA